MITDKFETALVYATRLHADQKRKVDGIPYISHLLAVTALVLEAGGSETEAIAALLHDSIEDQGGAKTRQEIWQLFGDQVVEIIDGCTESDITPKPPWSERKQRYLEQLRRGSSSVRLVSLADKLHNARSLLSSLRQKGEVVWTFFNAGKEKTLWFYRALLQIYLETGDDWMVQEFKRVVLELENL
jgi:(p)ppGpp synthase/HD superfamily hydrolase